MRTIPTELKTALANYQGEIVIRVNSWTDQADYVANPSNPDNVWEVLDFEIFSTTANAKLVTENNYTLSDFTVFTIERGVNLDGVEYTIESGLFFVTYYREDYGTIKIKGSSYPNIKIYIAAGDQTYQEIIEAFCAEIGKTAVFKETTAPWLSYQFFPDGKFVRNNKAERFESLIRQKYTILVYEESPNSLVFYNQDDYLQNNLWGTISWSPELSIFVTVAFGGLSYRVMTSPDGINWTARQSALETVQWLSVCWSPELLLFVAVGYIAGSTSNVMTSQDGINWTLRISADANYWISICWSPELSLFVAVSFNGTNRVMTSPDGINWTARTAAAANQWVFVYWAPAPLSLFIALSHSGVGNRVMTSPDGINWTSRASATDIQWNSVCWSPALSLLVAVGNTGTTSNVMTSPDGINWTVRTGASVNSWKCVVWSPELLLFVAVASGVDNKYSVMTSPDGINWTSRLSTTSSGWDGLVWSPELSLFVATAYQGTGNRVMTSPDGINWSRLSTLLNFSRTSDTPIELTYKDGPSSHIIRSQSEMHFIWDDELGVDHTSGDVSTPIWNLGFLPSTDDPPVTNQDTYYKFFLQKSPVRLDITDSDKVHFTPHWSIDPTKTIDAMIQVSEHFHPNESPSWYQNIRPIILFDEGEAG